MNQTIQLFRPLDRVAADRSAGALSRARAMARASARHAGGWPAGAGGWFCNHFDNCNAGTGSSSGRRSPAPPPMIVQPLAPDQALKVNAEIPVASGPNPAADAFLLQGRCAGSRAGAELPGERGLL